MRNLYKAFTLSELMIALGVIGVLCGILIPLVMHIMPNQNTTMAKRAYYALKSAVNEMINDEGCYPDKTQAKNPVYGFQDSAGYPNCELWPYADYGKPEDDSYNVVKFATLLADKLNTSIEYKSEDYINNRFTTSDGMVWVTDNVSSYRDGEHWEIDLYVDVNGADEPNCASSNDNETGKSFLFNTGGSNCSSKKNYDRIHFTIRDDGKVTINTNSTYGASSPWAASAISIEKDITDTD